MVQLNMSFMTSFIESCNSNWIKVSKKLVVDMSKLKTCLFANNYKRSSFLFFYMLSLVGNYTGLNRITNCPSFQFTFD